MKRLTLFIHVERSRHGSEIRKFGKVVGRRKNTHKYFLETP